MMVETTFIQETEYHKSTIQKFNLGNNYIINSKTQWKRLGVLSIGEKLWGISGGCGELTISHCPALFTYE